MESIAHPQSTRETFTERGSIMSSVNSTMLVDSVDDSDNVLGPVQRSDVIRLGVNFRVVHVLVFNSNRELLVQHIAPGLRHEGMWGSSAAGFVQAGETYEACARRKLAEELNTVTPPLMIGKTSMLDGSSQKFIGVFEASHDGRLSADPASASEVEFLSLAAIATHRASGSRVFTPTFLTVVDFYLSQRTVP